MPVCADSHSVYRSSRQHWNEGNVFVIEVQKSPDMCPECGHTRILVMIGESYNWDSATTFICADCLRHALRMLEGKEESR